MSYTATERDDLLHAIRQTLEFYRKPFTDTDRKFWLTALGPNVDVSLAKRALHEHYRESRFSPMPADIIKGMAALRPRHHAHQPDNTPRPQYPQEIAQAWLWFIGKVAGTGKNQQLAAALPERDIDPDLQDRYLRIVNEEAARLGQPEAVPDQFKMPEVWAKAAPSRQEEFA